MDDVSKDNLASCACCGELFHEDKLNNGICEDCYTEWYFTLYC